MHAMSAPPLILTREAARMGSDHLLRDLHRAAAAVRLRAGVYIDATAWSGMDADERFRTRVRAVAAVSRPDAQFSHDSAAAMWRLPSIGPWPERVHEVVAWRGGGSNRVGVTAHGQGVDSDPVMIDGVVVTSLTRTLVDVARTSSMVRSVAMLDAGLRRPRYDEFRHPFIDPPPSREELDQQFERLGAARGATRAARAIAFADPGAESPGESFARIQFHALGYPPPVLQREFFDELGVIGIADFYWPELDLALEFDGRSKYGNSRKYQRGMTLEQILMREKDRERRFRRVVTNFDRLGWELVEDRARLARYLAPYGLVPPGRLRPRT